jgi:hypothetical protein
VLLKERIPAYLGDWWLPHCDDKGRSTEDDEVAIGIERDERELVVFDRSFLRNASSESALAHPDLLCIHGVVIRRSILLLHSTSD